MVSLFCQTPELDLHRLAVRRRREGHIVSQVKGNRIDRNDGRGWELTFKKYIGNPFHGRPVRRVFEVNGLMNYLAGLGINIVEHVSIYIPRLRHYSLAIIDVILRQEPSTISQIGKGDNVFLALPGRY